MIQRRLPRFDHALIHLQQWVSSCILHCTKQILISKWLIISNLHYRHMFRLQVRPAITLAALTLFYCSSSLAGLVNSTVDDSSTDSRGAKIQYLPEDSWNSGSGCQTAGCSVQLDASQLNLGTWHESTVSMLFCHTPCAHSVF
jgi:hypothetical protein